MKLLDTISASGTLTARTPRPTVGTVRVGVLVVGCASLLAIFAAVPPSQAQSGLDGLQGIRTTGPATEPTPAAGRVGPSFDCAKAADPLALLICGSDRLARADLTYNQTYQVLRQQLGGDEQASLRQQAVEFLKQVRSACNLPRAGAVAPALASAAASCVERAYDAQRATWSRRLAPAALAEATRPLEEHIRLQRELQKLGYLSALAAIDGVYGAGTRDAIRAWQAANGLNPTGLLGEADAQRLAQASPPRPTAVAAVPSKPDMQKEELEALKRQIEALKADAERTRTELAAAERMQAERAAAEAERARAERTQQEQVAEAKREADRRAEVGRREEAERAAEEAARKRQQTEAGTASNTVNPHEACMAIKRISSGVATACAIQRLVPYSYHYNNSLKMINNGSWNWMSIFEGSQCVLKFQVKGVLNGNSYERNFSCPFDADKIAKCTGSPVYDVFCASEAVIK